MRPGSNRDADASPILGWQTGAGDWLPGGAFIRRLVDTAAGTERSFYLSGLADGVPERRVDDPRVAGSKAEIDGACDIIFIENLLPGAATVGRAEDPTLGARSIAVAHGRQQNHIWIARINQD